MRSWRRCHCDGGTHIVQYEGLRELIDEAALSLGSRSRLSPCQILVLCSQRFGFLRLVSLLSRATDRSATKADLTVAGVFMLDS